MTLPDLTKLTEQELIATMPPLVSVFLHGVVKRPVGDAGHLHIACGWCDEKVQYNNTTPEGWSVIGNNYCCSDCAQNVLPEHCDE